MNVSDFTTGDSERRAAEANLVSTETTDAVNAGLVGSADKSGQMLKTDALNRDSDSLASQSPLNPSKALPSDGAGAGLSSVLGAADKAGTASELTRSARGFRAARGALLANGVSKALQDTELEGLDDAYYKGKTTARLGKKLVQKARGNEGAKGTKGAQKEAQNGLGELNEKKYRRPKGNKEIQRELQSKRNQMTSRAALQANSAKTGASGASGAAAAKGGSAAAASGGGGAAAVLGGAVLVIIGILIFFLFLGLLAGIIGDDQEDTGSLTGNEAIIAQYLLDQGFSKAAVAGVLGNIFAESGGNPASDVNMDGMFSYPYERACGLFQYTHADTVPPYYTHTCEYCRYKRWCSENGKTWSDLQTQMEWSFGGEGGKYGGWESRWSMRRNYYLSVWAPRYSWLSASTLCTASEYKNQSDPAIAAFCWMAGYEGPRSDVAHLDRRIEAAQDYFNKLNTSSGSGQTYANSTGTARSIADWCYRTPSTASGYCAKWVSNVYENATGRRPGGNANDMYFNFCVSSDRSELKVGMIIASGPPAGHTGKYRSGSGGTTAYGHVGIYVGDNKVMHSTGGSVHTDTLDDWITSYTVKDMDTGQIMTAKWGYPSWV